MNGVLIAALALTMVQQTDTTFAAGDARRLELSTPAGRISVTGWDRSEVRVRADHSSRTYVEIRRSRDGSTLDIEAEARRGPATIVDYEVWVPRSFSLEIDADMSEVTVDGVAGDVEIEVTRGDVTLRGGNGSVDVSSVTGRVLVEGARGRVQVETAANEIRLVDVEGDLIAESAGGDIVVVGGRAASADLGSVGGRIFYDGGFRAGGTYFFGSHGGAVTLVVPDGVGATMSLTTVYGSIVNRLGTRPEQLRRGERHRFDVGGGGPLVEAETFGGRIGLVRRGADGSEAPAPRGTGEHGERGASRGGRPAGVRHDRGDRFTEAWEEALAWDEEAWEEAFARDGEVWGAASALDAAAWSGALALDAGAWSDGLAEQLAGVLAGMAGRISTDVAGAVLQTLPTPVVRVEVSPAATIRR